MSEKAPKTCYQKPNSQNNTDKKLIAIKADN